VCRGAVIAVMGLVLLMVEVIMMMKLISYAHVCNDLRKTMTIPASLSASPSINGANGSESSLADLASESSMCHETMGSSLASLFVRTRLHCLL